jgi:pimeloyl-ACP methyl ester carboxylesterase
MIRHLITYFLLLTMFCVSAQDDPGLVTKLTGSWTGTLQGMRIGFNILEDGDSLLITMDSPDQGVNDIPVNTHSFEKNHIVLNVDLIGGIYSGDYLPEKDQIDGIWIQRGYEIPLLLVRKSVDFAGPGRPQEPRLPFPYIIEDVTFSNLKDQVQLAGTLTLPDGNGPFSAVVLVTGSGPQDRNEEIMGHKPFWVIADFLTRNGFAVLRYDDRGYGQSTGDYSAATTLDFADDAMTAIHFLQQDPRIKANQVGILGHSEGAMIAPIVASSPGSPVGFLVMLAPPGLTGRETMNLQAEKLMREFGKSQDYISDVLKLNNKIYTIVVKEPNEEKAAEKIRKAYHKFTSGMSMEEKQVHGLNDFIIEKTINDMLVPWMRVFIDLDIRPYLASVTSPVLILSGSNDLQVDPVENNPPLEKVLKESGHTNYKIIVFPGLNHLFQTSATGLPAEYGMIEETISPVVLEAMLDWLAGAHF